VTTPKSFSQIVMPDNPPASAAELMEARLRELAEALEWHRDSPIDEEELVKRVKSAEAIVSCRATVPLTGQVMSNCSNLRIIARAGTGVDHIDLEAATKLGITVTNSQTSLVTRWLPKEDESHPKSSPCCHRV